MISQTLRLRQPPQLVELNLVLVVGTGIGGEQAADDQLQPASRVAHGRFGDSGADDAQDPADMLGQDVVQHLVLALVIMVEGGLGRGAARRQVAHRAAVEATLGEQRRRGLTDGRSFRVVVGSTLPGHPSILSTS